MKKIFGIIGLVLLIFISYKGYIYYQDRYVGTTYYTKTSATPAKIQDLLDSQGKKVDTGYSYSLIGVNEKGEKKKIEFEITTPAYPPNTYLEIRSSKKIVLKQATISEKNIPKSIKKIVDQKNP